MLADFLVVVQGRPLAIVQDMDQTPRMSHDPEKLLLERARTILHECGIHIMFRKFSCPLPAILMKGCSIRQNKGPSSPDVYI
jgi:hypothetical protein